MATKAKKTEVSIAEKLDALFNLQKIDSEIDRIRTIRGELPLEVQDLEDEIVGLSTRLDNLQTDLAEKETAIVNHKNTIKEATTAIEKYKEQQNNVRNNREYESFSKEIEFQTLEIQLCEKRIKESKFEMDGKKEIIDQAKETLERRKGDLVAKKGELDEIVAETQKEEDELVAKSEKAKEAIDDRLISAYERLRKNARNGLAVVPIERDSCGGCFNKIPPQRQLDIQAKKKVLVCEHCGRILVGSDYAEA
jgi:uncharacterized protein